MIPLYLRLSGFLSYRDPVDLDFASFDLACISGDNGAGKSSLLDAMTWALFGQARMNDDAQLINSATKLAEVIFDFSYEANVYRIQRIKRIKPKEKPTLLEFFVLQSGVPYTPGIGFAAITQSPESPEVDTSEPAPLKPGSWKVLTGNSVRETEGAIQKTLRMDYETFTNASFFLQGRADQFTQQRPGDRKRILSSILGLDIWDGYRKRAVEERMTCEGEMSGIDSRLHEINAELDEEPVRRSRLAELQNLLDESAKARLAQAANLENLRQLAASLAEQRRLVDNLDQALKTAVFGRDQLADLTAARQAEQQTFAKVVQDAPKIEAAYQAWQAARRALEAWEKVAAQFREQDQRRSAPLLEIETERARLSQEAAGLKQGQESVSQAQAEVPRLEAQRLDAQTALEVAVRQVEKRAELDAALRELHQSQADAKADNPRLRVEMDGLKERIDRLGQAGGGVCPLCGQPLTPEDRQAHIESLTAQGKLLAERFRQNQALLKDFESRVTAISREIATLATVENELRQRTRLADQLGDRLNQIAEMVRLWQEQGALRLAEIERQIGTGDFALEARRKLAAVDAELKATGYDAAAHEAARQAELTGRVSEADLRALKAAQGALAPLEREIADMLARLVVQDADIARQRRTYDEAAASFSAAAAQLPDLDQAEQAMLDLQEQENRLRMEVGAARQKVDVLEALRRRQKDLAESRDGLARRIARLKRLVIAFGKDGVPALLIEQALPEIQEHANQILERLSGGSMNVRFETRKDYKDKNREDKRETLDILISDRSGERNYEMYSGGEAFRVNFAIRLALSRVLAQRAGARLQTLVIDEGFGSQDAQGRQRLIEAINLVKVEFSKILVITHLEELKEAFPNRIEVEKTDRGSSIRVI